MNRVKGREKVVRREEAVRARKGVGRERKDNINGVKR